MRLPQGMLFALLFLRALSASASADVVEAQTCDHQPPSDSPINPTRKFDPILPQQVTHKLENPLRPGVSSTLTMLAFGDSAMWGNGLDNPHKYAWQVAQYVANGTGRAVQLVTYAHSGANIADANSCYEPIVDPEHGTPSGDLNAGLPTVSQQEAAAFASKRFPDAELVLVGGCM